VSTIGTRDPDHRAVNREVGYRVREHRRRSGMNQQQLADLIGLSRPSISNVEAGNQALDVPMLLLVQWEACRDALDRTKP
jgi:DNA-binding XRE family transcriptional regulator